MKRARNIAVAVVAASMLAGGSALASPKNELSLAAGIDSAYDGNVYNSRGPDFVNRINPHASYRLIDTRIELDTSYDFAYWTYALGKAANSINQSAALSLEVHPTVHTNFKLADQFSRAQDPGYLTRIGVVAPQIGVYDNITDASVGAEFTRRLYGALGYTYHFAEFDPLSETLKQKGVLPLYNGAEHDVQGTFVFRVFRHDDLRFAGRYQMFTAGPEVGTDGAPPQGFSNTDPNRWDIGDSYSPTVGWAHKFRPDLELSADAGPLFYQALSGQKNVTQSYMTANGTMSTIVVAPGSGVTYRAGALLRYYTDTWRSSLSYNHDMVGATGAGTALWADVVYGQVGYHWLERFDAHVGAGYFRNGLGANGDWAFEGVTTDAMLDYRIINNLRIGAYYSLLWQKNGPGAAEEYPTATVDPTANPFPATIRNIVGLRLLAVIGADAKPPRREIKQ